MPYRGGMEFLKKCSKCKELLPVSSFCKHRNGKDGINASCKRCGANQKAAYYKAHPEKKKAKCAAYQKANPEKKKAWNAAYYKAQPEKNKARFAAYQKANPEKNKAKCAAYYKANPEKNKARLAAYRKANPEKQLHYIAITFFTRNTPISSTDIPPELIEAKLTHLKLVRKLKEK